MTNQSQHLFEKAKELMPGGVNSPVRAFRSVGGTPIFIEKGHGSKMTDVDGREYIDLIGSWGAMIVGHAHPSVVSALQETLSVGTSFGTPCPLEIQLAEEMLHRVPSLEKVRMVNSGTEAVMSAIRLARAFTGKHIIIKYEGCYHGHADPMLVKAGSGVATFGLPDSPGVPAAATKDTVLLPYNSTQALEEVFQNHGNNIAGVILEPVAGNMGVIPPNPHFLAKLRELTNKYGAMLIFDEVMTGFRVDYSGAQGLYNIEPDISTFGKVIGGGLPVGAYGGKKHIMATVAPEGPMYQAGTLSGNPLAMRAGLETLKLMTPASYTLLESHGAFLEQGLLQLLKELSVRGCVQRVGSMLTLFFGVDQVQTFDDAKQADHQMFADFFQQMLQKGVHLPPSGYEAWFLSIAHTQQDLETILEKAKQSLQALRS